VLRVVGKSNRLRLLPFRSRTGHYALPVSAGQAHVRVVLVAVAGACKRERFTLLGVSQMLESRGLAAGMDDLHAHQFRYTAAHAWLSNDGGETNLCDYGVALDQHAAALYRLNYRSESARCTPTTSTGRPLIIPLSAATE
jgi:hypothetical protein